MLQLLVLDDNTAGDLVDLSELPRCAADLTAEGTDRRRSDVAWKFSLDCDLLSYDLRQTKLKNWISYLERI